MGLRGVGVWERARVSRVWAAPPLLSSSAHLALALHLLCWLRESYQISLFA